MPADLHRALLSAVSPFDQGVSALNIQVLRDPLQGQVRPSRTAAVLVPILAKPEPEIVLTVRSENLPQHAGQVSFPGGSVDHQDRSAVSTALREAQEEIGLDASRVAPLGFLDRFDTISDYRVLPVVGLVRPPFAWQADHREVSDVFTVPLELAVDRQAYTHRAIVRGHVSHVVSSLQFKQYRIWGITAAILLNLGSRLLPLYREKTNEP